MKRDMSKCRVCDKYLGDGSGLCGEHWYKLSISGYPITERKIKAFRLELQQSAAEARHDTQNER